MIKGVLIFCIGIVVGSWNPDIYSHIQTAFVESGIRDSVVESLVNLR